MPLNCISVLSPCFSCSSIRRTTLSPLMSIWLKICFITSVFGVSCSVHFCADPSSFRSNCFSSPCVSPPIRSRKSLICLFCPGIFPVSGIIQPLPFHWLMPSERTRRTAANGFCICQSRPRLGISTNFPVVAIGLDRDFRWRYWIKLPWMLSGFCSIRVSSAVENAEAEREVAARSAASRYFFMVVCRCGNNG